MNPGAQYLNRGRLFRVGRQEIVRSGSQTAVEVIFAIGEWYFKSVDYLDYLDVWYSHIFRIPASKSVWGNQSMVDVTLVISAMIAVGEY